MAEGFVFTAADRNLASPGELLVAEMPLPQGLYVLSVAPSIHPVNPPSP